VIVDIKVINNTTQIPFVRLRWIDQPTRVSGWIPLEDHPDLIAMAYASNLKDLVGQYTVKVHRRSANSSAGIGRIVTHVDFDPDVYEPELPSSGVKL
jgi:hypothetical protein